MADRCENINAWKGEKTKRGEQRAFPWCKCGDTVHGHRMMLGRRSVKYAALVIFRFIVEVTQFFL